ncbi:MAG TPA: hypothetical protein VMU84_20185 [Thermoanaerobaculia bacterium]|nr:hypothetical protein [Thermoanaerobaculia bacterium]
MSACPHDWQPGWLLVSSVVYWSEEPGLGLLPRRVLVRPGLRRQPQYKTRPEHFRGVRCSLCKTFRTNETPSCTHELTPGFIFPYSPLLWWPGDERFQPGFLYPFRLHARNGREPEVVFAPKRFLVSISDARCAAGKCGRCGAVEVGETR